MTPEQQQIEKNLAKDILDHQENILKDFLHTLLFTTHLSKPIEYQELKEIENEFKNNVLIVGNIGNGKSTVTNKLAGKDVALAK